MQDVVAVILAVGVILLLLSGSYLRCFWMDCSQAQPLFNETDAAQFWETTMATILGALAGYISGRTQR